MERLLSYKMFFENKRNDVINYYSFDWDDNLLSMPTVIHMDKLVDGEWIATDVSTSDFSKVRSDKENWRLVNNDPSLAFSEFRDNGPRGENAFLADMKEALARDAKSPAWDDFIECLVNGSLFAIITARGHEAPSIRRGVEYIIDEVLTESEKNDMYNNLLKFVYLFDYNSEDYDRIYRGRLSETDIVKLYLDNCDFVGVSAPSRGGTPDNPERAKEIALMEFSEKVNKFAKRLGVKAKIGFSDDDKGNVKHISDLFSELSHEEFPNIIQYVVKDTSGGDIDKMVRTMENYHQAPGMGSSMMSHWDNMTNRLINDKIGISMDDDSKQFINDVKLLWDKFGIESEEDND